MSLDYPNREDWLKIRDARNFKRPLKYRHISKPLMTIKNSDGSFQTVPTSAPGNTLITGATQRKAASWARKIAARKARRLAKRAA